MTVAAYQAPPAAPKAIDLVKLKDNLYTELWYIGQWQNGEYYGIAPVTLPGAHQIMFPKPAWHAE